MFFKIVACVETKKLFVYVKKILIFVFVYSTVTCYSENTDVQWRSVKAFIGYKYLNIRKPGEKETKIISQF